MPSKRKPSSGPTLRGRVWVEWADQPALTEAGADLLEQIDDCHSLSEAARRLHYSYRRAWLLVDAMNRRWPQPLVDTAVGGKRGGGSRLTDLGGIVLRSFRDVQLQMEALLDYAGLTFQKSTRL